MSRAILCPACGTVKPTHPEDAARGLFSRYVRGELLNRSLVCDGCDKSLHPGDPVVCVSQPTTVAPWEHEYLTVSEPNAAAAVMSAQHGASDNSEQDQPKG